MEIEIKNVASENSLLIEERKKIRCLTRSRKEKNNLGQFEKEVTECPECHSRILVTDYVRAETVCGECCIVIESDIVDHGPEWRAFDADQKNKRTRTGPPSTVTLHDKGLSTVIDYRNRDFHGRALSGETISRFYHLRKWHRRIRKGFGREKNLIFALSELNRMVSALGLPKNIHEAAAIIYRQAAQKNLIRGRSVEGVATAALYAACKQCRFSRTPEEIGIVSRVSRLETGRIYRFISRELKLRIPASCSGEYISRFCSNLNLSSEVQCKAREILSEIEVKIGGKKPSAKAAAAIFKACVICGGKNQRYEKTVADAAGVTTVTIRNLIKEAYGKGWRKQIEEGR